MSCSDTLHLSELAVGESCRVAELDITGQLRSRLSDLGLVKGTRVTCVLESISGDPTAFLIRGSVIALRSDVTSRILCRKVTENFLPCSPVI